MDINQLKSFVTVAHQGSLTQAAEILHLSQPAVSAQIKAIERNLDVVLFDRKTQGMSLTHAGKAFLPRAEAVLQQMHELDVFVRELGANYRAQLTLGVIDPIPRIKVAQTCRQLQAALPDAVVHLRYGVSDDILNAVRKKEIHGGFFIGSNPYRNVYDLPLEEIRYAVVAPQSLATEIDPQNPKTLQPLPWLNMPEYAAGYRVVHRFWKKHKILPESRLICDHITMKIALSAAGLGVALVPLGTARALTAELPSLVLFESLGLTEEVNFIYANEFENDYLTRALRDAVAQTWDIPFQAA